MIGRAPLSPSVKDRLDPVFMFEPDKDGDYIVIVSDTRRESAPILFTVLNLSHTKNRCFAITKIILLNPIL